MYNLGNILKQHLLSDESVTFLIDSKIYNIVVVTSETNTIKPPFVVIEINSLSPTNTKDWFTILEVSFSIIVLATKYNDIVTISEVVKDSFDNKDIDKTDLEINGITFENYSENFDKDFELYTSRLEFSCKVINK